jgi:glycosyltransferase involved in cell wall biosynthesis
MIGVCITTYNHQQFIQQCIDSVLQQVCSEPIMIYIGDDASTDNTTNICRQYSCKHSNIRLVQREKNIGLTRNTLDLLQRIVEDGCNYIAMLDGDDYWTNTYKLQTEWEYLSNHPNCGLVHTAFAVDNQGALTYPKIEVPTGNISAAYQLYGASTCNCTVLFRAKLLEKIPMKEFIEHQFMCVDYPMYGIFAQHTDFAYIPLCTAAWRQHESVSNAQSILKIIRYRINRVKMWHYLDQLYPGLFHYKHLKAVTYILRYVLNHLTHTIHRHISRTS